MGKDRKIRVNKSTYSNANPVPEKHGGIDKDETFSGLTMQQMFDKILYPEFFGTLTAPSRSFSSDKSTLQEIGNAITIGFTASFNKGSINPQYESATPYRSGNPNTYSYTGTGLPTSVTSTALSDSQSVSAYSVLEGNQSWTMDVSFDQGPQPKGSYGTNFDSPYGPGTTLQRTVTITGVYPFFATTSTIGTFTKQSLQTHGSTITLSMVTETDTDKQTLEVPSVWGTLTELKQYNTLSGEYDTIDKSTFTITTITKTINGASVNYDQYVHNGSYIESRTLRFIF